MTGYEISKHVVFFNEHYQEIKMKYMMLMLAMIACGEEPAKKAPAPKAEAKKEVKKEAPKKVEAKVEAKKEEPKKEAVAAKARTGEEVYTQVCSVCHQPTGQGMEGVYPPLAGSDWIAKSNETLAKIVLHGVMGEIEVSGKKYNNVMTPQGALLNDEEIANVLTYVRSSWGNKGDAVKPEEVKAVRDANKDHGPWNAGELK